MTPSSASGAALGVDFGGSGIKACTVDLDSGEFTAERERIDTPQPSTPEAVAEVIVELASRLPSEGPVGVTVPGVVQHGTVRTAANIDQSWIGCDGEELLADRLGRPVRLLNDADAAGVAEAAYGAARGHRGLVLLLTLGTGIGSALMLDGTLVPNSELGHLEVGGHEAEAYAADSARSREDLSWEEWAARLSEVIGAYEAVLWPDLIVLGGGVSKKADRFVPLLDVRAPVVPADLRNRAGIVGAARLAAG